MSDFADISIDFYPQKAMEFIATAAVFKRELVQHVTAVSKLGHTYWILCCVGETSENLDR